MKTRLAHSRRYRTFAASRALPRGIRETFLVVRKSSVVRKSDGDWRVAIKTAQGQKRRDVITWTSCWLDERIKTPGHVAHIGFQSDRPPEIDRLDATTHDRATAPESRRS